MEWAKGDKHRGFIASWPQFGVPMGLFLANLVVLATSAWAGDAFLTWAWRIPFFVSLILLLFGLYIRLGVVETPTFRKLQEENKIEKAPIVEVIKRQPKEIIVSAFCRLAENSCFYIFTAFILFYGTQHLHMSRDFLLQAVLAASVLAFFMIPLSGWLSDRIGRKRLYIAGIVATGLFSLVYFPVLDAATPAMAFFVIFISLVPHDIMYGPQAALIAESFTGRLRYSGASLGYQLAAIIAGGPAPIIATALVAKYNSGMPVGIYLCLCAVGSLIATLFLKDRTNTSIAKEYDEA
jgi:MFS family permease